MTSIDFYFNADERLHVACRLATKAFSQNRKLLVFAPEPELATRFDRLLWTMPAIGFVPHCRVEDSLAPQTPILIAGDDTLPPGCDVLLNLAGDCPPHFERFERLLEVVTREDADRASARSRYRFYKERGYLISDHDLARGSQ